MTIQKLEIIQTKDFDGKTQERQDAAGQWTSSKPILIGRDNYIVVRVKPEPVTVVRVMMAHHAEEAFFKNNKLTQVNCFCTWQSRSYEEHYEHVAQELAKADLVKEQS